LRHASSQFRCYAVDVVVDETPAVVVVVLCGIVTRVVVVVVLWVVLVVVLAVVVVLRMVDDVDVVLGGSVVTGIVLTLGATLVGVLTISPRGPTWTDNDVGPERHHEYPDHGPG
jgi:hypothetical protein